MTAPAAKSSGRGLQFISVLGSTCEVRDVRQVLACTCSSPAFNAGKGTINCLAAQNISGGQLYGRVQRVSRRECLSANFIDKKRSRRRDKSQLRDGWRPQHQIQVWFHQAPSTVVLDMSARCLPCPRRYASPHPHAHERPNYDAR